MKKMFLSLALATGCATLAGASIYQESSYHETGIVVIKDGTVELRAYSALPQAGADGQTYYRWHCGPGYPNFVDTSTLTPLSQGYRFEGGKMLVYDFVTGERSVALDFTLQAGDSFTTPDGTGWTVEGREQRTFTTLHGPHNKVDYQAGHTVLKVRSQDGTKADEWIENLGAVRYPLMIQPDEGIVQAHVAYMCYGQESPYLVLDFSDGRLHGRYVGNVQQLPATGSIAQVTSQSRAWMEGDAVKARLETYSYMTRAYCYAFLDGDDFAIFYRELGPFRDREAGHALVDLTFPAVPAGSYRYTVDGKEAATGITTATAPVTVSPVHDLWGRRLGREPHRGIYIKDGRKAVVESY